MTLRDQVVDKTESTLPLKCLALAEYQQLVADSTILEQDKSGIKVFETPEGLIVKLFRRKRLLTSAIFKPYATRFVENARRLNSLGIKTVTIEAVYRCAPIKRTLIVYQPVPGRTLRDALRNAVDPDKFITQFAAFFSELHDKGVLFRSIHLNNIIVSDSVDAMGLIDIADMKVFNKGLAFSQRIRNLRHLSRYKDDRQSIKAFGVERFVDIYFSAGKLASLHKEDFLVKMQSIIDADDSI